MYDQYNFSHNRLCMCMFQLFSSVKMQVLSNVDGKLFARDIIVQNPLKDLLCGLSEMFYSLCSPSGQLCLIAVNFTFKKSSANSLDIV